VWRIVAGKALDGARPAKEFQISARREPAHSAASFASSFSHSNACAFSKSAETVVCATIAFSNRL